jgi:hypothetical protein
MAKPPSLWTRRFYSPEKLERAEARAALRHRRYSLLEHRLYDALGGAPSLPPDVGVTEARSRLS